MREKKRGPDRAFGVGTQIRPGLPDVLGGWIRRSMSADDTTFKMAVGFPSATGFHYDLLLEGEPPEYHSWVTGHRLDQGQEMAQEPCSCREDHARASVRLRSSRSWKA
jgi:hypothetical protein